jgi:hypothetical protein
MSLEAACRSCRTSGADPHSLEHHTGRWACRSTTGPRTARPLCAPAADRAGPADADCRRSGATGAEGRVERRHDGSPVRTRRAAGTARGADAPSTHQSRPAPRCCWRRTVGGGPGRSPTGRTCPPTRPRAASRMHHATRADPAARRAGVWRRAGSERPPQRDPVVTPEGRASAPGSSTPPAERASGSQGQRPECHCTRACRFAGTRPRHASS